MKDLSEQIKNFEESDDEYSEEGMARLKEEMKNYEGDYKLVSWQEIAERLKNEEKAPVHPTGIGELDNAIGGLREQQVVVVAGDSGHGKTAMGMFLLEQLVNLSPVMIPLEQSAEELIDQRQRNGHSIPNLLSPNKIASECTTDWIEKRVVQGIGKYNTNLVLIDHIGYVDDKPEYKRENLAFRVGERMRELKTIAKKWNVIMIVLVHISQHDEGKPPMRKDIKNSSDIIQESDLGFFIWRKNEIKRQFRTYDNKTLLSVQKNRGQGKHVNVGLIFDSETGRYYEENTWVDSLEQTANEEYNSLE